MSISTSAYRNGGRSRNDADTSIATSECSYQTASTTSTSSAGRLVFWGDIFDLHSIVREARRIPPIAEASTPRWGAVKGRSRSR